MRGIKFLERRAKWLGGRCDGLPCVTIVRWGGYSRTIDFGEDLGDEAEERGDGVSFWVMAKSRNCESRESVVSTYDSTKPRREKYEGSVLENLRN